MISHFTHTTAQKQEAAKPMVITDINIVFNHCNHVVEHKYTEDAISRLQTEPLSLHTIVSNYVSIGIFRETLHSNIPYSFWGQNACSNSQNIHYF